MNIPRIDISNRYSAIQRDRSMPKLEQVNQNADYGFSKKPELIYSTSEILYNPEKDAIQKITAKYDSLGRLKATQSDNNAKTFYSKSYDCIIDNLKRKEEELEEAEDEEENDSNVSEVDGDITEEEIMQVECFFRSHKTYVYVCHCLANLYFTTVENGGTSHGEWELSRTGIPVLIFDKGETKARTKRLLQIVLAERGTGFVLWRDIIDNLTNYRSQDKCFQTMYLSIDHRRMAGLSFDNATAAEDFLDQVESLTSDPLNISLSVPKKKKTKGKKSEKAKLPKKCDISQPCCFQHVISVDIQDKPKLYTLSTLVPNEGRSSF